MQDPALIQRLIRVHVSERIQKIDHHDRKYGNQNHMAWVRVVDFHRIHKRRKTVIEKERDDRRESKARKETRISRKVQRKQGVVPVMESAQFLYGIAKSDLSKRDDKEDGDKEERQILFFRNSQKKVNEQYRETVSDKEREVHVSVIDLSLTEKHPYIFQAKAREGDYDH